MNKPHENPSVVLNKPGEDRAQLIAADTIDSTARMVANKEELLIRLGDARKALELASTTYKATWLDWLDQSEKILPELRSWRMAMDTELTMVLKHFGEVRQFFLSEKHDVEVKRLREFVELMERLKALKDSGFLDRVADTMLKLEENLTAAPAQK